MRVRLLRGSNSSDYGHSDRFNTSSLSEVIVTFDGGEADSCEISELEVWIQGRWLPMHQAFKEKQIIPSNENTRFKEPANFQEREVGYY